MYLFLLWTHHGLRGTWKSTRLTCTFVSCYYAPAVLVCCVAIREISWILTEAMSLGY